MPIELGYLVLLFALFVVPRALQRFLLPSAITSFALGVAAKALGLFDGDTTIPLLASFGIISLFLLAGLEVNGAELVRGRRVLLQHLALRSLLLGLAAAAAIYGLGLEARPAWLFALAIFTPSTGFILSALDGFGLEDDERFWVRSKAIATELLALAVMFVALQSASLARFGLASAALLVLVLLLPVLFRLFARVIAPWAPRSEFAFLLMIAVTSAYATKALGVYYLVGAFFVGVAAQRFRKRLPSISSEQMLHAVEAFGSVFAPFYFFQAGRSIEAAEIGWAAIGLGLLLVAVGVALRLGATWFHRTVLHREPPQRALRIGLALSPTLVFTLVLADILREQFAVPAYIHGGLVVYAMGTTLIPGFALRAPPPSFDAPHLSDDTRAPGDVDQQA